jgi:hypothetical protein
MRYLKFACPADWTILCPRLGQVEAAQSVAPGGWRSCVTWPPAGRRAWTGSPHPATHSSSTDGKFRYLEARPVPGYYRRHVGADFPSPGERP